MKSLILFSLQFLPLFLLSQEISLIVYDDKTGACLPETNVVFDHFKIHEIKSFITDSNGVVLFDYLKDFGENDSVLIEISKMDYLSQMVFISKQDTKIIEIFLQPMEVVGCGPPILLFLENEIEPTNSTMSEMLLALEGLIKNTKYRRLQLNMAYNTDLPEGREFAEKRIEYFILQIVQIGYEIEDIQVDYLEDTHDFMYLSIIE